MIRQRVARRAALGVAAAALLATAGCGPRPHSGASAIDKAHDALAGAGPALRESGTATVTVDADISSVQSADRAGWQGRQTHVYGANPAVDATYGVAFVVLPATPSPFDSSSTGTSTGNLKLDGFREITVDGVRYHRPPAGARPKTATRPWEKLAPGQDRLYGSVVADPDLGILDPDAFLNLVGNADSSVQYLAATGRHETVGGVATTLFQVSCPLGRGCDAANLGSRFTTLFPDTQYLTVQVWLDGGGRPRKLHATGTLIHRNSNTASAAEPGLTVEYNLDVTMTFSDFGRPASVTAPPAAQVS